MQFVVVCLDFSDSSEQRRQSLGAHRAYVNSHAETILMSGPLLDGDGVTRSGQLFVLDVADLASAEAFVQNDPFVNDGIFETVIIRRFAPVITDGTRRAVL